MYINFIRGRFVPNPDGLEQHLVDNTTWLEIEKWRYGKYVDIGNWYWIDPKYTQLISFGITASSHIVSSRVLLIGLCGSKYSWVPLKSDRIFKKISIWTHKIHSISLWSYGMSLENICRIKTAPHCILRVHVLVNDFFVCPKIIPKLLQRKAFPCNDNL